MSHQHRERQPDQARSCPPGRERRAGRAARARVPGIRPVTLGGEHRLDNGVLLQSDVRRMFDWEYLGVDPSYRLRVSPR